MEGNVLRADWAQYGGRGPYSGRTYLTSPLLCSNQVQATHSPPYFRPGGGLGSFISFGCSGGHQTKDLQFTRESVLCVSALTRHASFSLDPLLSDFTVCALRESTSAPLCFHTTGHQKPVSPRRESRQCLLSHIWVVPDLHQTSCFVLYFSKGNSSWQ